MQLILIEDPDNPRHAMRNMEVRDFDELENFLSENKIDIGIITTPKDYAQETADIYIRNGIKAIWNFATIDLVVPEDVVLENVRLSESLFTLSYYLKNKENE